MTSPSPDVPRGVQQGTLNKILERMEHPGGLLGLLGAFFGGLWVPFVCLLGEPLFVSDWQRGVCQFLPKDSTLLRRTKVVLPITLPKIPQAFAIDTS